MNLLRRIKAKLRRNKPEHEPLLNPLQAAELDRALRQPAQPPEPPKSKGRVIKQTRHSEFNPNPVRHGGRIVKVMPRQLQKIKAAQEKVEDDEQPRIED